MMMGRCVVFALVAMSLAQAAFAQPEPPPTGDERAALIAGIRASYPAMPETLVQVMADSRRQVSEESPCALLDWMLAPGSGAPAPALDMMRGLSVCALGIEDVDAATAAARLGDQSFRFDVAGDVVTLLAKSGEDEVFACCSLQINMTRIGDTDFWAARRRLADIDAAMLSLTTDLGSFDAFQTWRGPKAPPMPAETPLGKWAGQIVDREIPSAALGETRRLRIYLPPGYAKDRAWPALFLADGGAVEFGGLVEKMIEAGEIVPIVIISAESGEQGVVGEPPKQYGRDLRAAEYLRGISGAGDRFDRHMTFFADELVAYAIAEFNIAPNREQRAVAGKSNGGVFALWAGVMHPDVFATAIPMSAGHVTLKPEDLGDGPRATFHLAAGLYEAPFIAPTKRVEAMLLAEGYDVSSQYYAAGHFHDLWVVALREALLRTFPAR
jgi:enterochelin esterase-like enzyme